MSNPMPPEFRLATESELADCLAIRRRVFIEEQQVDETLEVDGQDPDALQFITTILDTPVATARVRIVDDPEKGRIAKIERVAVLPEYRGKSIGKRLMMHIIAHLKKNDGIAAAMLGAQEHAIPFYEKLGFAAMNTPYMDAGIPHDKMILALAQSTAENAPHTATEGP